MFCLLLTVKLTDAQLPLNASIGVLVGLMSYQRPENEAALKLAITATFGHSFLAALANARIIKATTSNKT